MCFEHPFGDRVWKMFSSLKKLIDSLRSSKDEESPVEEYELCCNGQVHIAYRGLADDRMYIAYDRHWDEVKFFKPNGLRVFCSDCRTRVF